MVSRFGIKRHLFDPSPTGVEISKLEENRIAGKIDVVEFLPPLTPSEGSFRKLGINKDIVLFECRSLFSFVAERGDSSIDLLKMDIAEFEYDVIESIIQSRLYSIQICV